MYVTGKIKKAFKKLPLNWTFLHNKIAIVEEETNEEYLAIQYLIESDWKLTVIQNPKFQNQKSQNPKEPKWILKQIKSDKTMVTLPGEPKTYYLKNEKKNLS